MNCNPPKGHPAVEIFLSKRETEILSVLPGTTLDHNLSKEEWLAMRGLAEDDNDWVCGGALFDVTKLDILENNQYQA